MLTDEGIVTTIKCPYRLILTGVAMIHTSAYLVCKEFFNTLKPVLIIPVCIIFCKVSVFFYGPEESSI